MVHSETSEHAPVAWIALHVHAVTLVPLRVSWGKEESYAQVEEPEDPYAYQPQGWSTDGAFPDTQVPDVALADAKEQ
jgi:hypothetical protein